MASLFWFSGVTRGCDCCLRSFYFCLFLSLVLHCSWWSYELLNITEINSFGFKSVLLILPGTNNPNILTSRLWSMPNSYYKIQFVFHHLKHSWLSTNTLIKSGDVHLIIYEGVSILNYLEGSSRSTVGQYLRGMWVRSGEERPRWLVQRRRDNPSKSFILAIVHIYRRSMCLYCKPSILKYCVPIIKNVFWWEKGIIVIINVIIIYWIIVRWFSKNSLSYLTVTMIFEEYFPSFTKTLRLRKVKTCTSYLASKEQAGVWIQAVVTITALLFFLSVEKMMGQYFLYITGNFPSRHPIYWSSHSPMSSQRQGQKQTCLSRSLKRWSH